MDGKLYGKLAGRCSMHGASHFGGDNKHLGFNRQRHICEVAAECASKRKRDKKQIRRRARRKMKEEFRSELDNNMRKY